MKVRMVEASGEECNSFLLAGWIGLDLRFWKTKGRGLGKMFRVLVIFLWVSGEIEELVVVLVEHGEPLCGGMSET
jgi:hypothetical protein